MVREVVTRFPSLIVDLQAEVGLADGAFAEELWVGQLQLDSLKAGAMEPTPPM